MVEEVVEEVVEVVIEISYGFYFTAPIALPLTLIYILYTNYILSYTYYKDSK